MSQINTPSLKHQDHSAEVTFVTTQPPRDKSKLEPLDRVISDLVIDDLGLNQPEKSQNLDLALDKLQTSAAALSNFCNKWQQSTASESRTTSKTNKPQPDSRANGKSISQSFTDLVLQAFKQPQVFAQHYRNFAFEMLKIIQNQSEQLPAKSDRRFRDAVWRDNFMYRSVLQTYIALNGELDAWLNDLNLSCDDKKRSQFLLQQFASASSPSNSPLNPVAIKRAYQTGGQSIVEGLKHLLGDIATNQGMPSQVPDNAFTVGKDVATSAGAVIWRCEILELIQYRPTDKNPDGVYAKPVMIVPPQINKFYIFDINPKKSVVKHLLDQGIQTFVVSWRNPSAAQAHWGLDLYIEQLEKAIDVICDISNSQQINLISACAGGLTSMALLGYLAAIDKPTVGSHSLLVTGLEATSSTTLGLFASKQAVEQTRQRARKAGVMDGKELAHVFAWLRPTDLVWNYWVNNYLLGKEPPAMDVLFWDNDSTRLPAALHSDFIDIFLNDAFATPNQLKVRGKTIDIRTIKAEFFCVAGEDDYIMPWLSCYQTTQLVTSPCEFVLSDSGHIQSILRPPGIAHTHYYTNKQTTASAEQWMASADKNQGSWWLHWAKWLNQRSCELKPAPESLGNKNYPVICAAPGEYVLED